VTLPHAQVATGIPRKGELLPDFELLTVDGALTRISEVHGRKTMVLIITGDSTSDLLSYCRQLAEGLESFRVEEANVFVVVRGEAADAGGFARSSGLLNAVFGDRDGRAHARIGNAPTVFVTDRHGEIFAVFHSEAAPLPSADELLKWVQFVNMQCEECFPPEWPV
jgi:peroxiredoxin